MSTSRDWEELEWAWKGWRDESGKKMRNQYEQFVGLLNEAAVLNGKYACTETIKLYSYLTFMASRLFWVSVEISLTL